MSQERCSGAQRHLEFHFQGKPRCSVAGSRWTELERVTKAHMHIKSPASRTNVQLVTVTWLWVTCQPFPHAGFAFRSQWLCLWQHIQGVEAQSGLKMNTWLLLFFTLPSAVGDRTQSAPDVLGCLVADRHIFNYILKYAKEHKTAAWLICVYQERHMTAAKLPQCLIKSAFARLVIKRSRERGGKYY